MSKDLVEYEYNKELLDEIFLEDNGVGNTPVDKQLEELGHRMDPNLPTAQELEFCRLLIRGVPRPDAYMQAFNRDEGELNRNAFSVAAHRLLKRPRVAKKYLQLQQRVQELAEEDLTKLVSELNDAKDIARDLGQPSAMVTAIKTKANLLGLEKSNTQTNNIIVDMSDDQRKQLLSRISSRVSNQAHGKHDDIIDAEYTDVEQD